MPSFLGERRFTITPETPLVFVHLFKCAGTSVHDYLASVFPPEAFFPGRQILDYEKIEPGRLVYSGHMLLRQWDRVPVKPHFVTWLREPAARVLSAFHFLKVLPDSYVAQNAARGWLEDSRLKSLVEFVHATDESTRLIVRNGMARMLCANDGERAWWRLAWAARAALRRFAYIGIAERTDECLAVLARRFGLPPPARSFRSNTYTENAQAVGNGAQAPEPAPPEALAAIRRYARADLLLYRKAVALSARMT